MNEAREGPRRLAVFGAYSDHDLYQRNRTLVQILDAFSEATVYIRPQARATGTGFSSNLSLFKRMRGMFSDALSLWTQRALLRDCDTVFVPYPAYFDLLVLWVAGYTSGKLVVADAFLELNSTVVEDRKLIPPRSLRAWLLNAFQNFTLSRADIVLIDTPEQASLLCQHLKGSPMKVADVPVGIDESLWTEVPFPALSERVQLLFWGTFIPLHGVEHIVAAARILESRNVPADLLLIGDGQMASEVAEELKQAPVAHLRWKRELVDTQALRAAVTQAHVVLGVFGDSNKAGSVIPYKVHQGLAAGRPVITRSGPATERIADERRGVILCPPSDPLALASAIETTVTRLRNGWSPTPRTVYEQSLGRSVLMRKLAASLGVDVPDLEEVGSQS
ncbi:glycosyltransferase [Congregibacter brevis]|uniref:Glycosyltransferase n=1 Tax=Congregibacter brevis TaxID=3081201 RepID=A0ABZ0ICF7_9GAMM|nr:glycosyltransferase [Congregibacter sp. IMCC45268]